MQDIHGHIFSLVSLFLFLGGLIGILHLIFSIITAGVFQLAMPFPYNKQSSIRLLTSGWELNDTEENSALAKVRIGISS